MSHLKNSHFEDFDHSLVTVAQSSGNLAANVAAICSADLALLSPSLPPPSVLAAAGLLRARAALSLARARKERGDRKMGPPTECTLEK